jgi:hypothetical protein
MNTQKKESVSVAQAKTMLAPKLYPILERLIEDYKFASLKVHGAQVVSPRVIAELIILGWRNQQDQQL